MQAALGLAQLERIDELVSMKRRIFEWYQEELAGIDGLRLNVEPDGVRNSYWMVTVTLDERYDLPKTTLMRLLKADGIDTRPFFYPLSALPAFRSRGGAARWRRRNPTAYRVSAQGINLPSALSVTREDVNRVCAALRRHLTEALGYDLRTASCG
jgi:perosamine synthetase